MAESIQTYCEKRRTVTYSQESKRLFEILFDDLSIRAQHTLINNDINSIEDLMPWIEGEFHGFMQFKKCGRHTSEELMAMVLYLRQTVELLTQPIIEGSLENKESHNLEKGVELRNEGREEDAVKRNECALVETKTDKSAESDRKTFDFLFNALSIRAQNILRYNNINCIEDLAPWIKGESDSFLKFRNCGKRTSEELMEMVLYLRAKVDLSCQFDSESVLMNQGKKQSLLDTITKASENKIQSQRQFDRLFNSLTVRTRNVLCINGILNCESLLTLASKPVLEIMKLRKCGKKTVQELLEAANRLQKIINEAGPEDEVSIFPFDGIIQFDEGIQNYLTMFKKEHGHWPMVFVLFSTIKSLLKPREFAAFEDRYGIWKHEELEELSKQRVHQIFERTVEKLYKDIALKKLCEHEDWSLYNVNIIPVPFSNNEDNNRIWWEVEQMIANEKCFLKNCFCDNVSYESQFKTQLELLSHINISSFKALLLLFGHLPLWQGRNCLVPYCPQEKKGYYDPLSPIVIDKRYVFFNFNKAFSEIGRLKKVKKDNDIILSVEKYFVENEDYWKRSICLSDVDKTVFVSLLKNIFRKFFSAIIVDDNLIFKANRIDFSEKLYKILSIEGTRLHRDELFIRLKKVCNENGLRCDYSKPSQIIPFLVKDSRIVSYGKSSYWGLKEWGETYGSIRELALRMMKESTEPIHIDALTKLIMESRPDSNEKSISSIIRQTISTGELLLFWGDYIGYPNGKFNHEFILMPRSFDEWLKAFKEFVLKNKRYPNNDKDFEGFLNRWYQRAIKLTDLSAEEILKIDALEKELTHYPHNAIENNFLHKCNLYKKFVEGNNRMLEETDDPKLFKWFYNASLNYITYKDNRSSYFSQLLQFLSKTLL